jgi:predicted negative regulator of RcsB-dependent stress response
LGDVYYKLGRKREAEYQWSRALDYDPTDEERSMIARKLSSGLSAAQAAP